MTGIGKVSLIGAGPGDPDLLTVKSLKRIPNAEVVVYDRLVSQEIMDLVPPKTALYPVGKKPKSHPSPQEEINQLLVDLAKEGKRVVRLKGGDPFIFGRGSEEAGFYSGLSATQTKTLTDSWANVASASVCLL